MKFFSGMPCMSDATKRCMMYEEERPLSKEERQKEIKKWRKKYDQRRKK